MSGGVRDVAAPETAARPAEGSTFGTEWPDWMPFYDRVVAGAPLELAKTRRVAPKEELADASLP